jgi:hypothetical protein
MLHGMTTMEMKHEMHRDFLAMLLSKPDSGPMKACQKQKITRKMTRNAPFVSDDPIHLLDCKIGPFNLKA